MGDVTRYELSTGGRLLAVVEDVPGAAVRVGWTLRYDEPSGWWVDFHGGGLSLCGPLDEVTFTTRWSDGSTDACKYVKGNRDPVPA